MRVLHNGWGTPISGTTKSRNSGANMFKRHATQATLQLHEMPLFAPNAVRRAHQELHEGSNCQSSEYHVY